MGVRYPTVVRRYMSTVIDCWLIIIAVALPGLLKVPEDTIIAIRVAVLLLALLVYEPVFSTRLLTLGQLVTRIRVRSGSDVTKRIPLWAGYVRYAMKIFLGVVSLLTVPFTQRGLAIHDMIVKSVVVRV